MRLSFSLFFGIFAAMALSNAVVPVLPSYAASSAIQGAIYSAYFLGAFLTTLPAGILSDRYGRVPMIRLGLTITVISGLLLSITMAPLTVVALRFIEGLGAGIFIASAMSYINSQPEHKRMSGYLIATLNAGLVTGLALSGWLAAFLHLPAAGIFLFTVLSFLPAVVIWISNDPATVRSEKPVRIIPIVRDYRWLWYSSVILVGITGIATSLYPAYSGFSPDLVGYFIASMSIATIAAVLVVSCLPWQPVTVIRYSAVFMGVGIGITYFSPVGFVILGVLAGFVMIAQMAFLAGIGENQGVVMGIFSTSSYLGMSLLPFVAGVIASVSGYPTAFLVATLLSLTVALMIGRCTCPDNCTPGERYGP